MSEPISIALDLGTTGSRAFAFTAKGERISEAYLKHSCQYPQAGWVEQNPNELVQGAISVLTACIKELGERISNVIGIGLTNQRETTIVWDAETGEPIAPAIVWQDRRTTDFCSAHRDNEAWLREKTGLFLDPYFSATKISWILNRASSNHKKLIFGTVDTWILWNLTNRTVHATDPSNASRTLLYNIHTKSWDPELCSFFHVPMDMLPRVQPSFSSFGAIHVANLPSLPIRAVLGDQQASLYGHECTARGSAKITFGTGAFYLRNTGHDDHIPAERLIRTIAWQTAFDTTYAIEGALLSAGSAVEWLCREGFLNDAKESEEILRATIHAEDPIAVPAFFGLGSPEWDPHARALFCNISAKANKHSLVRALLEGIAWQVADLLATGAEPARVLRVDGGLSKNTAFLMLLSATTKALITRGITSEMTSWGAARAAFHEAGIAVISSREPTEEIAPAPYPFEERRALWQKAKTMVRESIKS